jgi:hypothetical protein
MKQSKLLILETGNHIKSILFTGSLLVLITNIQITPCAILFQENFEKGDLKAAWTSQQNTNGGEISIVRAPVRSGLMAGKATISSSAAWGMRSALLAKVFSKVDSAPNPVYLQCCFYLGNNLTVAQGYTTAVVQPAKTGFGPTVQIGIKKVDNSLVLSAGKLGDGKTALTKQAWHVLTVSYTSGNGTGKLSVNIDGKKELSAAKLDLSTINEMRIGQETSCPGVSGSVFFDDVTIADQPIRPASRNLELIHAEFFGHLGMKVICILTGRTPSDRLEAAIMGNNGYSKTIFSKSAPLAGREDFILDLRSLGKGSYTLTVSMSGANNTVLCKTQEEFDKPYDGIPAVGIDENNSIRLKGTLVFPITPFGLGRNDIRPWVGKHYINSLFAKGFDGPFTLNAYREYLDSAAAAKTFGVIGPCRDDSWPLGGQSNQSFIPVLSSIQTYVTAFKSHPGVFMWTWLDESITVNHQSAGTVKNWKDLCHQIDNQHLVVNNEAGTIDTGASEYKTAEAQTFFYPNQVADVYCFDYYVIEYSYHQPSYNTTGLAQICDRYAAWNYNVIPFMSFVETCDLHGTGNPAPTPEQLRMLIWVNIIHGARGICWFHYFNETPKANFLEMARFTEQIGKLAPLVLGQPCLRQVTDNANQPGKRVDLMVRENDSAIYIFAVRVTEPDQARFPPIDVRFSIAGMVDKSAEVFEENRIVAVANGSFSDSFSPNAVHIYRVLKKILPH